MGNGNCNNNKVAFCKIKLELLDLGTGLGGRHYNMSKLQELNCKEAMTSTKKSEQLKEIDKEHEQIIKFKVQ